MGAEARVWGMVGSGWWPGLPGAREGTVSRGVSDLDAGWVPLGRGAAGGRGRKRLVDLDLGLRPALVEPDMRGDPMSPLPWTIKSTRRLARGWPGRVADLGRHGC